MTVGDIETGEVSTGFEIVIGDVPQTGVAEGVVYDTPSDEGDQPNEFEFPPEPEMKAGLLKPVPETTFLERIFIGIAGLAIVSSLAAMIITLGNIVVIIAGVLTIVLGPYAYFQQTQLTDIRTLKETTKVIEQEVQRLTSENDRLENNIDELGTTIDDLKTVESSLGSLTAAQGNAVDILEKQVEKARENLKGMRLSTRGRIANHIADIIFLADKNLNGIMDPNETDYMIKGIKQLGAQVVVNEEALRAKIENKDLSAAIDLLRDMMDDNIPHDERIFDIIGDELLYSER